MIVLALYVMRRTGRTALWVADLWRKHHNRAHSGHAGTP